MKTRIGTLAVLTAALACAPAYGAPTKVKLRVEGTSKTIFEGRVTTDAHPVTGDSSGPHTCDGTNGGASSTPGPTATGALDDASDSFNFSWAGTWSDSFEDFLVDEIGPDRATATQFWGVHVNGRSLQVGGCQQKVERGDEVLFAYDSFGRKVLLLRGPRRVRAGERFKVRVIDGETGDPVEDATVGGEDTNGRGVARLRFEKRGVRRLKARADDAVRSNQLRVKVRPRQR
jgi:hypothetical protein